MKLDEHTGENVTMPKITISSSQLNWQIILNLLEDVYSLINMEEK